MSFIQTFSDSQLSFNPDFSSPLMSEDKKKQRTKRALKSGERPGPRSKKRKKEEDERQAVYPSNDPVMTNLKQVSSRESLIHTYSSCLVDYNV